MSYTAIVLTLVLLGAIGGVAVALQQRSKSGWALLRAAAVGAVVGPLCGVFLTLAAATWGLAFLIADLLLKDPRVHRAIALSAAGASAGVVIKVFCAADRRSILGRSLVGDWVVYFLLWMLLFGPAALLDREDLRELQQ